MVQKPCRVGVLACKKYFQGAGLMWECKNKIFFGGCGLNPSVYGSVIFQPL